MKELKKFRIESEMNTSGNGIATTLIVCRLLSPDTELGYCFPCSSLSPQHADRRESVLIFFIGNIRILVSVDPPFFFYTLSQPVAHKIVTCTIDFHNFSHTPVSIFLYRHLRTITKYNYTDVDLSKRVQ